MSSPPIPGPLFWFAADQIASPPASGSALQVWNDLSGNGYDAVSPGNAGVIADETATGTLTATTSAASFVNRTFFVAILTGTTAVPTITDSQSNTWTLLASGNDGTYYSGVYYCIGPSVSSTQTFTATAASGTVYIQVSGFEGGPFALDVYSSASGATAGSIAPQGGDLVMTLASSTSASAPTGFAIANLTESLARAAYIYSGVKGAYNPTWGGTTHWSCNVAFTTSTASASAPLYETNLQNGLPGVVFNGSDLMPTGGPFSGPFTIYAVAKVASLAGYRAIVGALTGTGIELRVNQTTGAFELLKQSSGAIATSTGTVAANETFVVAASYANVSSGAWLFRINGVPDSNGTITEVTTAANLVLGENVSSGGEFYDGPLHEVLVYNAVHTLPQMQAVEAYLQRWFPAPAPPWVTQPLIPILPNPPVGA